VVVRGVVDRLGRHRRRAVTVLDNEIDRHLAFEAADVSVTEVVAQLVHLSPRTHSPYFSHIKLAFYGADTDTDTDILADILARIVARMSACRSACHRNNFRKSRTSDVSARILARMSVAVSVSWNSSLNEQLNSRFKLPVNRNRNCRKCAHSDVTITKPFSETV